MIVALRLQKYRIQGQLILNSKNHSFFIDGQSYGKSKY